MTITTNNVFEFIVLFYDTLSSHSVNKNSINFMYNLLDKLACSISYLKATMIVVECNEDHLFEILMYLYEINWKEVKRDEMK